MFLSIILASSVLMAPNAMEFDTAVRVAAGEARGERSDMAIAGVCHVMVNRFLIGKWGTNVAHVVTSPWQFSAYNRNDPNYAVITRADYSKSRSYRRVYSICRTTFRGRLQGYLNDITKGADHYYSGDAIPYWANGQRSVASIGHFRFFSLLRPSKNEKRLAKTQITDRQALDLLIKEVSERQ